MGRAIDTILTGVTNQVALANVVVASGDTLQVRQFSDSSKAVLENVIMKGTAARNVRIVSPSLHDVSRGINLISAQAPTTFSLPREVGQPLTRGDVLSVQATSGGADSTLVALQHYYDDLNGSAAQLYHYADIAGYIDNIKPLEVDVTTPAAPNTWQDATLISTENLLHANEWYAVLGYNVDVACGVVALRGPDTGNYRIGGPGSVIQGFTADYFAAESDRTSRPHIPIFNANNAGGTVVSVADNAASTAVKVQLILAELAGFSPR